MIRREDIWRKYGKVSCLVLGTGMLLFFTLLFAYKDYVLPYSEVGASLRKMFLWLAAGLTIFTGVVLWGILRKWSIQKMFIPIGLTLGIIYMFVIPLMAGPDETMHASTAYSFSNILMGQKSVNKKGKVPVRGEDTIKRYDYKTFPDRDSYERLFDHFWNREIKEGKGSIRAPLEVNLLMYLPQTLGILIARLCNMNAIHLYMMGRLFGLLFYIGSVYLAIRLIPFAKNIMFFAACLPMCMEQAATLTYDTLIICLSFLLIGHTLYLAYEKPKVTWKDWILPSLIMAMILPVKIVYVFLAFLLVLIPKEKYQIKYGQAFGVGISVGVGLLGCVLWQASKVVNILTRQTNTVQWGDDPSYTIAYLLQNPHKLPAIFFRSLRDRGEEYLGSMIGSYLCRFYDIAVPLIIIFGFVLILLLASLKLEKEKIQFHLKQKCWMGFITVGVVGTSCLSMLLAYTSLYSPVMQGVQGRYFLPALPLCLMLFRNENLCLKRDIYQSLVWAMGMLHVFTLLHVFITIIGR